MKRKCTRILCMVLSVMMVVSLLPLTVSAACSHNYKKVYTIENEKMHSYKSRCSKCGTVTEGWGYAGWEDHSYNGQEIIHGTFDGNSDSEIETCLSTWGWNSSTKSAIRQAAKSSLSFTTGLLTDCTAVWMDTSTNRQLYSKTFGSGTVTPAQSKIVSVSYSEYSGSGNYIYKNLAYSGDTSGTSTSQTYSQTYTASSKPLKVTFYCHPEEVDEPDQPEDDDPIIDDPVVDDPVVTTGEVTIYVRDASTYALLSSAYVSGSGCGGYTNRYGYVSFGGLELGRHTFTASKSGYYSNSGLRHLIHHRLSRSI